MSLLASGLPKSYIKRFGISKKAWHEYRKSKRAPSRRSSPRKKVRSVARRKYTRKRRRRAPRTIPVLPIVGVVGGVVEPISRAMAGDYAGAAHELIQTSTGIDILGGSGWHPDWMLKFWGPVVAGIIGHKIAGWTGLNRVFSRLPAPLNKLRL